MRHLFPYMISDQRGEGKGSERERKVKRERHKELLLDLLEKERLLYEFSMVSRFLFKVCMYAQIDVGGEIKYCIYKNICF